MALLGLVLALQPVSPSRAHSAFSTPHLSRYTALPMDVLDQLKYNDAGLIPAIVQDFENGEVLMMGWMNRESLQRTIETGRGTYWSRSRGQLWL